MADLEDLKARLEAIGEDLADAAMEALREALESGERGRPDAERRLTQARRAVERAVHALDAISSVGGRPQER
ncbi:MAG: hypothetical protein GEV08_02850 [Acidimicrobiia bacterium]|nr:hypothetical protein [Acidimicrobiia bacterium]